MSSYHLKDPDAVLDYVFDWAAPLAQNGPWLSDGETITAHTVTVDDPGITIDSHTATDTLVTAWLSGGTVGEVYLLVCHITTSQGRQEDETMHIQIAQR